MVTSAWAGGAPMSMPAVVAASTAVLASRRHRLRRRRSGDSEDGGSLRTKASLSAVPSTGLRRRAVNLSRPRDGLATYSVGPLPKSKCHPCGREPLRAAPQTGFVHFPGKRRTVSQGSPCFATRNSRRREYEEHGHLARITSFALTACKAASAAYIRSCPCPRIAPAVTRVPCCPGSSAQAWSE